VKKALLSLATLVVASLSGTVSAQEFAEKTNNVSYSKPAYIYLENGDSLVGNLTKIGYRKGLIDEVKIKVDDKKQEVDVNTIKTAYFPISAIGKLGNALNKATNLNKMKKTGVNEALIRDGYVLYEKSLAVVKGKTEPLLMQLINPAFSDKIRVYADQFASESASYGVGGMTLAGGDDLSYYIKKGDAPAEKVRRKDFKEKIPTLFGDCPTLATKLQKDFSWADLPKYIYEHSTCGD
jgi:hypothetical protein